MKNVIVIFIFLISVSIEVLGQNESNVQWFERLFEKAKVKSIDQKLATTKNKARILANNQQGKEEAQTSIEIGALYLTQLNDYEHSMEWFIRSLVIADSLNLNRERVFAYIAMARVFEKAGNHTKSSDFLIQAVNLNEKEKDVEIFPFILIETGRANSNRGEIDEALESFELAIDYARDLKQPEREADALFDRGNLFMRKGNFSEALAQQKEALKIRRTLGDLTKEAATLNQIGELYSLLKNEERALANHLAALKIRRAIRDDIGSAETYNNIGRLYLRTNDVKKAISNLQLALEFGRKTADQDQLKTSYDYLSQSFKTQKEYKKALEYHEQFAQMLDFSKGEENEGDPLEKQSQYIFKNNEVKIVSLEKDREQKELLIEAQAKEKRSLLYILILTAIILTLVLFFYLLMRRTSSKLKKLNATKDKLFSIIGHDLKGPLNSLTSFSSLLLNHADKLSKEEIKMLSTDLDKSLKNLMALLENLLEWSRSQTGSIDFKAERFSITAVVNENIDLLKGMANTKKIALHNTALSEVVVNAHRYSINTVARNLLSNAIKFTPEGGSITVEINVSKMITVSVQDTGVGMPAATVEKLFEVGSKVSTLGTAKEKGTGLGLILCKDFVEKNGGTIHVESTEGAGSKFYFTIPAN